MHHNTLHDYSSDSPVSIDEFIEFYAYMSTLVTSDHVFDQMLTGPWNLDNMMHYYYAGTSRAIEKINAHEKWKLDHHKKMFAGNEYDIISPNQVGDYNTIHRTRYQDPVDYGAQPAGHPTLPAGINPIWGGSRIDSGADLARQQIDFYHQQQKEIEEHQQQMIAEQQQQQYYEQPQIQENYYPEP